MKNLTLGQVKERLQFLRKQYPRYSVWVNMSTEFKPVPISGKCEFFIDDALQSYKPRGNDSGNTHYGYVTQRKYEKLITIKVEDEFSSLNNLELNKLYNKAIIVDDTNIMGICGISVDNINERVVLLNSNYNDNIIDWSIIGISII